ncbi:MAG: 4-alpha-glucanotransferase [Bacteroides sp.]|nr:4-alpha-glucanotransferase [Roseburia sp.]MCM1346053.1 4-alpha-glucanotransferase [Bacteroides sp.]MCM1420215.1 4-alpha-glucanotransferase [Bacteroides sp.]
MKIHFSIEYRTKWGEDLRVILKVRHGDSILKERVCPLETFDGQRWEGEVTFHGETADSVEYKYALYSDDRLVWTEWEIAPHVIGCIKDDISYLADDIWRPIPSELPLFSSAYTECIARHEEHSELNLFDQTLQFRVVEPRLRKGEHLAIVGSPSQLGNWTTPMRMSLVALQEWGFNIDASLIYHPIEYKYVIVDDNNCILQWEEGMNRKVHSLKLTSKQVWLKSDSVPRFKISNWKCAGVVVPIFSLRSENSYGIGDFGDMKTMIHWAAKTGMHAVQILPINDTIKTGTKSDSYPYNAISIYALHPVYCNISALHRLNNKLKMEKFMIRQQELNLLESVDYETVCALKLEYLRLIYAQEGNTVLQSEGFKEFFSANSDWLVSYAAFCYLRDKNGTATFSLWKEHSKYNRLEIERMCGCESPAYPDIALYYYIQYQLHLQMLDVRKTAHEYGVIIKGDIPIGISRDSVEAWTEPYYFNLDSQAGAPPDDFSVNGQNWGFPTYNWTALEADGCRWWLRRFRKMADYFDAFRIDHVLGFFRIWEIPMHSVHGLLGQFSPSMPLSVNDIEGYGLSFRRRFMTTPYITDETLERTFGYKADIVRLLYLDKQDGGFYNLKPQFDTQRKIEAAFGRKTDKDSCDLRDGLYSLVSDVLFVADRQHSAMYHPRISAQHSFVYQSLSECEKLAFNNLYNDYYYRRHNQFWYDEAMKKLPLLTQATRMLVCAEDLGMVPDCVSWVMEQLRILSLEIQSMPKAMGMEFGLLPHNPYRSVSTISTHDMPTLRQWWKEDYERAQRYYNQALHKDGQAPCELSGWLCEEIISRHLFCPSMLCLLSLQDWLSMDEKLRNPDAFSERINIPADPNHYWRWRMHITIEQLIAADELNDRIHNQIVRSGRD